MTERHRIPASLDREAYSHLEGHIFWMDRVGPGWEDVRAELTAAFESAREAAVAGRSMVFVVRNEDLLGRTGPTPAMVAAGLLSAARTAALEGVKKGWTANVIVYDSAVEPSQVMERAGFVLQNGVTTGETIHMGPGHIGKALV